MNYTVSGTYGGSKTPCKVHVHEDVHGLRWYAADGSMNVNATYDEIKEGVDIETLEDVDCFTLIEGVQSARQIELEVYN